MSRPEYGQRATGTYQGQRLHVRWGTSKHGHDWEIVEGDILGHIPFDMLEGVVFEVGRQDARDGIPAPGGHAEGLGAAQDDLGAAPPIQELIKDAYQAALDLLQAIKDAYQAALDLLQAIKDDEP